MPSRPLIYVIDDEKDVLKVLKAIIEDEFDCEVKTFATLEKSIKSLEKEAMLPKVILCDVRLPDGNGFELSVLLKKQNIKIPIIHITGLEGDDIIEEGHIVLGKPIDTEALVTLMKRFLK